MRPPEFILRQLAHPSGFLGRHVIGRVLNRVNAGHNALVLRALDVRTTARVLEVGFGGADLLEQIAARASEGFVAGVELSEEMVAAATARFPARVELRRGSVDSLPYPDASFDRVCSVNTIYFWPDLVAGLTELSRILRPGGRLVLGFSSDEDMRRAGLDRRGFTLRSPDRLVAALAEHGFHPGELTSDADWFGTRYALSAERPG